MMGARNQPTCGMLAGRRQQSTPVTAMRKLIMIATPRVTGSMCGVRYAVTNRYGAAASVRYATAREAPCTSRSSYLGASTLSDTFFVRPPVRGLEVFVGGSGRRWQRGPLGQRDTETGQAHQQQSDDLPQAEALVQHDEARDGRGGGLQAHQDAEDPGGHPAQRVDLQPVRQDRGQ